MSVEIDMLKAQIVAKDKQVAEALYMAAAKEELARQMFLRLILMGVKADLFRPDQKVEIEEGILTVDAYLGVGQDVDAPERVQ